MIEYKTSMKLHRNAGGWMIEREGRFARLSGFTLDAWLSSADPVGELDRLTSRCDFGATLGDALLPLESQEVWAAGVTYQRSKAARMAESTAAASAYDLVYEAQRPELFFKATPRRCVGPGAAMTLRSDSNWMVPEPELTLVIAANQRIVGYTLGNDLSCRDIEGQNTLYLPQAKVWDGCCAIGPAILINDGSIDIRASTIALDIRRGGVEVFGGSTQISRIRRTFEELAEYLFRHQSFPQGVFLMTGTGIVPGDDFTLRPGDEVGMEVKEIGRLTNLMC